ncbi:MAG: hypothetical protein KF715_20430 [Candidatus Didemnitutus sp.]|nr:hypothetical protein [Candidatus Didemnitutus sp.]
MKILAPLLLAGALAFTACGRNSSSETDARNADTSVASPAADTWTELRTYAYEKRGDFNSRLSAIIARLDAELSQLEADASAAKASQSRKDALAAVKSDKAAFDEKTAALARASQDTWNQARDEAAAAWDKLQASLAKARAEH